MINLNAFLKKPILFQGKFYIYPPSVNDAIDDKDFYKYIQVLTFSHEDVEDALFTKDGSLAEIPSDAIIPTPFQFLFNNCKKSKEYEAIVKKAFKFFIHLDIELFYDRRAILLGSLEDNLQNIEQIDELCFLEEVDFFDFQNSIRSSLGLEKKELPDLSLPFKARQMKAKARYRDKVKSQQSDAITLETSIAALCCMNMGLNPLNVGNISYAAVTELTNMYQKQEAYKNDYSAIMAGADPKKIKMKYWIREN